MAPQKDGLSVRNVSGRLKFLLSLLCCFKIMLNFSLDKTARFLYCHLVLSKSISLYKPFLKVVSC